MVRQFPISFVFVGTFTGVVRAIFVAPDNLQLIEVSTNTLAPSSLTVSKYEIDGGLNLIVNWLDGVTTNAGVAVFDRKDFVKQLFPVFIPNEYPTIFRGQVVQIFMSLPLPPFLVDPSIVLTFTAS